MSFKIIKKADGHHYRCASIKTSHGTIMTPEFMPVGTQATVKAITPRMLTEIGTQIILSNSYHLHLRPGEKIVKKAGGLHKFCGWEKPILTDSGGFQIFSLKSTKITDEGAYFPSIFSGETHFMRPEDSIDIQETLGSDIMMTFDVCPSAGSYLEAENAVNITTKWAKRCIDAKTTDNLLFGIVQGGVFEDLRQQSADQICSMGFDGIAIGGLSVGENKSDFLKTMSKTSRMLPDDLPHYLMGVGKPSDIIESVKEGIDIFDCVMPTRNARNGQLFTKHGTISIKNARFIEDMNPVENDCTCYCCGNFTLSYLNHLFHTHELLYHTLSTIHNLHYMHDLMQHIRDVIMTGSFDKFRDTFYSNLNENPSDIYR